VVPGGSNIVPYDYSQAVDLPDHPNFVFGKEGAPPPELPQLPAPSAEGSTPVEGDFLGREGVAAGKARRSARAAAQAEWQAARDNAKASDLTKAEGDMAAREAIRNIKNAAVQAREEGKELVARKYDAQWHALEDKYAKSRPVRKTQQGPKTRAAKITPYTMESAEPPVRIELSNMAPDRQ
jgi:hypothetical protein